MRRECAQHQCTTMPTYGTAQSKKPEYCAKHRHPGMVDVLNRRCGHLACSKTPSYGLQGTKTA
ncbi:unnamed protein product, partial [Ectocarpus sp. 8 AP-2014]